MALPSAVGIPKKPERPPTVRIRGNERVGAVYVAIGCTRARLPDGDNRLQRIAGLTTVAFSQDGPAVRAGGAQAVFRAAEPLRGCARRVFLRAYLLRVPERVQDFVELGEAAVLRA